MSRSRKILSFLIFLCLFEGGLLIYCNGSSWFNSLFSTQQEYDFESEKDSVNVISVSRTSFVNQLKSYGVIKASSYSTLIVPSCGNFQLLMKDVCVQNGSYVKQGDIVAKLDNLEIHHRLISALKEYEFRQEHMSKLTVAKNTVSEQEYNKAVIEYEKAQADYNAMLEMFNLLTIKAPFSGYIGIMDVSVGQQLRTNQKIVNIIDTKILDVEFLVDNRDANKISKNTKISVYTLDKQYKCTGIVDCIESEIDKVSGKVKAKAKIYSNFDSVFKHNLGVVIYIDEDIIDDVFVLPRTAIIDDGASKLVSIAEYSPYGFESRLVSVEIVGVEDDKIAIKTDEFTDKAYVIYEGATKRDGVPVSIKKIIE